MSAPPSRLLDVGLLSEASVGAAPPATTATASKDQAQCGCCRLPSILTQGQQVVLLLEKRVRATARCTVQEGECRDVRALPVSGPASPAASLSHFKEHSLGGRVTS